MTLKTEFAGKFIQDITFGDSPDLRIFQKKITSFCSAKSSYLQKDKQND